MFESSAIWKPDTYFINSHSAYLHTTPTFNHLLRILENGRLLYSSRCVFLLFLLKKQVFYGCYFSLTIKASCSKFLKRFPLDVQLCPLVLSSCKSSRNHFLLYIRVYKDAYGTKDIIYDWKLNANNGVEFERLKLSQFDLFDHKISRREVQLNDRLSSTSMLNF